MDRNGLNYRKDTGKDFYIWLRVLLMHFICTEWHTEAIENSKYVENALWVPQKLKFSPYCSEGDKGVGSWCWMGCVGRGVVYGQETSKI